MPTIVRRTRLMSSVPNAGEGAYYRYGIGDDEKTASGRTVTETPSAFTTIKNVFTGAVSSGASKVESSVKPSWYDKLGITSFLNQHGQSAPAESPSILPTVLIVGGVGLGAYLMYKKVKG